MTETFLIGDDFGRTKVATAVISKSPPFTVKISEGVDRSAAQNRLAFRWFKEIAQQTGDEPDAIRADCKLTIGVPIRREDDEFRAVYDEMFKPLKLNQKLALMVEPFDFAVTRGMTTKQMGRFLDAMWQRFAVEMGLTLTEPDPMVGDMRAPQAGAA